MKKKILYLAIAVIAMLMSTLTLCAMTVSTPTAAIEVPKKSTTISEAYIPSETFNSAKILAPEEEVIILKNIEIERVEPSTLEEANNALEEAKFRKETALTIHEGLLTLGYTENHPAVIMAKTDIENIETDIEYYTKHQEIQQKIYNWEIRKSEYPIATQVWLYMKDEFGWSDIVCAGIMGNLMSECGGCWTQDLDYDVSSISGYGMIQWLGERRDQLFSIYGNNPTVEDQLNFMKDELYGTNGVTKQVTESQLDIIMNALTPEECAFAFATYFERCAKQYRAPRKEYAVIAYEYFVD